MTWRISGKIQSLSLSLALITALRCAFLCFVVLSVDPIIDLGTNPLFLCFTTICGVLAATALAHSRLSHLGFGALCLAAYLAQRVVIFLAINFPAAFLKNVLASYALELHLNLAFFTLLFAASATWAFWRTKQAVTLEMIVFICAAIYLLSGHRDFHFDSPQVLNSLAWALGISPLWLLIILGAALMLGCLGLLFFASLPGRPNLIWGSPPYQSHSGSKCLAAASLAILAAGAFLALTTHLIHKHYNSAAMTRTANGVGQNNSEQVSPLGFHSALGGSNQPSALVRLEGDYRGNPFSPMLYLRESALSQFNGRELVMASRNFDQDISNTRPDESFNGHEDAELTARTPITQSVYLLSNHKVVFAIDYPLAIKRLKNPEPGRFKAAYRAYSMAPGFKLAALKDLAVGDLRWSEAEKRHYLTPHPDPRYKQMAEKITAGLTTPIEKAAAITDYLSANAIYTLTPGHEVGPHEDPVAPFLFGDQRGYCVHFAHATVYMLRSLGIPARIATGYLTDLSQSKDGHILLRMSDRHAWAEVFVSGRGWIPFDTKPEHVESHAETPVDMKLLEELMSLIGPGEEILPKDIAKGEANIELEPEWALPEWRYVMLPAAIVVLLLTLVKLYMLYGWLLPGSVLFKLQRSYIALLCRLYDLGYRRTFGETRQEFRTRVKTTLGSDSLRLTDLLNQAVYSSNNHGALDLRQIAGERRCALRNLKELSRWKRVWAALNPASALSILSGIKW